MGRECLVAGCGRWVKVGAVVCGAHTRTVVGRAIAGEVRELVGVLGRVAVAMEGDGGRRQAEEAAREAVREVRRRVRRGDFSRLLGEVEGRVSAEGVLGRAFEDELAALKLLLWRVVGDDELDVVRQAQAVSQVVGMTVRAAKEQAIVRKAGEGAEVRDVVALLRMIGRMEQGED